MAACALWTLAGQGGLVLTVYSGFVCTDLFLTEVLGLFSGFCVNPGPPEGPGPLLLYLELSSHYGEINGFQERVLDIHPAPPTHTQHKTVKTVT